MHPDPNKNRLLPEIRANHSQKLTVRAICPDNFERMSRLLQEHTYLANNCKAAAGNGAEKRCLERIAAFKEETLKN